MTVNLDAMLPRRDLDSYEVEPTAQPGGNELYLAHLKPGGRLTNFRKPDFQRETSQWTPQIIATFVKSVVDGDVIPAIIIWHNPKSGDIFVIDGAHRLSALIGWIHDDYGDGDLSKEFFGRKTSKAQAAIAEETRSLVELQVGSYKSLSEYSKSSKADEADPAFRRSKNLNERFLGLQRIQGSAEVAEQSFKRINSTAVAISKAELFLIERRRQPAALAARALMRAGTGHDFWKGFESAEEIRAVAREVYDGLIKPIVEFPIVTLDLPAVTRGYSASSVKVIVDLVSYLNRPPAAPKPAKGAKRVKKVQPKDLPPDDGTGTLAHLKAVKRKSERAFGRGHKGSLALHPGVYCYNKIGAFNPKGFIGAVGFVAELEERKKFNAFTDHRARFEDFLIGHREFVQQIGASQGGTSKGIPALIRLYWFILERLIAGADDETIVDAIVRHQQLSDRLRSFTNGGILDHRSP